MLVLEAEVKKEEDDDDNDEENDISDLYQLISEWGRVS